MSNYGLATISPDEEYARKLQAQFAEEESAVSNDLNFLPKQAAHLRDLFAGRRKKKPSVPEVVTTEIQAHSMDVSAEADAVRLYAQSMSSFECASCLGRVRVTQDLLKHMFQVMKDTYTSSAAYSFLLSCNNCGSKICLGCKNVLRTESLDHGATTSQGKHLTWHCDAGRMALLWFLLCGYDSHAKHNKCSTTISRKLPEPSKPRHRMFGRSRQKSTSIPRGVGYAPDGESYPEDEDGNYNGYDEMFPNAFVGQGVDLNGNITPPIGGNERPRAPREVDSDDILTIHTISELSAVLPNELAMVRTDFDINPPTLITAMLLRSSLLDKMAELLRNDSLEDATSRFTLYQNMVHLLQTLVRTTRGISEVLYTDRTVNKAGHNLLKVSLSEPTRLKDEAVNVAAPLALCMSNLCSQSEMVVKTAQRNNAMFSDSEEGQHLLLLCNEIIECNEEIQRMQSHGKARAQKVPTRDNDSWQKELAVSQIVLAAVAVCPELEPLRTCSLCYVDMLTVPPIAGPRGP